MIQPMTRIPLYEDPFNGHYLVRLDDVGVEEPSLWDTPLGDNYRPVICADRAQDILRLAASRRKTTPDKLKIASVELSLSEPKAGMCFKILSRASHWVRVALWSRRRTGRGWILVHEKENVYGLTYFALGKLASPRCPVYAVFHFGVRK